ncbi:MAG: RlmE family RNA methyltransferase [bacterium]
MKKWLDSFSIKAKKQGYPARSVFKLKQIDQKYKIIKTGNKILDLGASPGSWVLYASEIIGKKGGITAVDINALKIKLLPNLKFIKHDIFNPEIFSLIQKKFDVVLSDLSPSTSGIKDIDEQRSFELSKRALQIAKKFLKKDGNFVCKVFEGEKSNELFNQIKKCFDFSKRFRPTATRKRSKEIYIIARGFKRNF